MPTDVSSTVMYNQSKVWLALWLFPLVSAYAMIIMPLTLYSLYQTQGLPGLSQPEGHAHEMLFGLVTGLIAGYLSGRPERKVALLILLAWFAARVASLNWPDSLWSTVLQALLVALLLWQILPRLNAAKRWRNRILLPLIFALLGLGVLSALSRGLTLPMWFWPTAQVTGILLALLLSYMGGRLLAPAIANAIDRTGGTILKARVQPRIEGGLILTLATAALLSLSSTQIPGWFSALPLWLAALLICIRIVRWQPWRLGGRLDLLCLLAGYGWLAPGLIVMALQQTRGLSTGPGLHLVTIGTLGILATGVIMRLTAQRRKRDLPTGSWWALIALLFSLAAVSRALPDLFLLLPWSARTILYFFAAGGWSLAWGLTLIYQLRTLQRPVVST
ncbi:NnrS family protein [Methylophaga nitratireducenticrescens]|uniref:NnrS protein n=2 Tax=Methylophaga nitratireducenticrescens TaxID=754476 RepID=I1XEV8_METNJ|nr:NnrS family protein [Methylophaga nitratireducenticrescens]AFI82927.1 NnrS family protein [Methylophaga nitratireducenticrescens]AUZ83114.1 NnrS family protein [Methylophaga nitratireducenticrescens]